MQRSASSQFGSAIRCLNSGAIQVLTGRGRIGHALEFYFSNGARYARHRYARHRYAPDSERTLILRSIRAVFWLYFEKAA